MLDIGLNNIKEVLNNGLVRFNFVYPMTKKSHFRLNVNIALRLSNDSVITIPKDFQFDGSSAPRFLWWIFPSYGDFFFASLVHDFMYQTNYLADDVGYNFAQKFADKEMLIWSNKINSRNFGKLLDNYLRYKAVRLFGKKVYIK